MALQQTSVVTPERYEQGITWQRWMEVIDRNQDKFVENYEDMKIAPADVEAFKALMAKPNGPAKILCLGEALVDLICERPVRNLGEADSFRPHFGGALANVAVAASRAGGRAAIACGAETTSAPPGVALQPSPLQYS